MNVTLQFYYIAILLHYNSITLQFYSVYIIPHGSFIV